MKSPIDDDAKSDGLEILSSSEKDQERTAFAMAQYYAKKAEIEHKYYMDLAKAYAQKAKSFHDVGITSDSNQRNIPEPPAKKVKQVRKLNGYNLFIRTNYEKLKSGNGNGNENESDEKPFHILAKLWSDLNDEDRQIWKKRASELNDKDGIAKNETEG